MATGSAGTVRGAQRSIFVRLLHRPGAAFGIGFLTLLLICALWPTEWLPHNPYIGDPSKGLLPPAFFHNGNGSYLLGTDSLGRDTVSMIVRGSRYTLEIVAGAGVIGLAIGVTAGLCAGYFGGWLDSIIMRLVDVQLGFPALVLVIAVVAAFGPNTLNLILVLGVVGWAPYARLMRSSVLSVRERGYVEAARASGIRSARIIVTHVLPNTLSGIVVFFTLQLAQLILMEAALSFLGLGVQPPDPSWGGMISDARQYLTEAWWASAIPGVVIILSVLACNFIGDDLRDVLDPTIRNIAATTDGAVDIT